MDPINNSSMLNAENLQTTRSNSQDQLNNKSEAKFAGSALSTVTDVSTHMNQEIEIRPDKIDSLPSEIDKLITDRKIENTTEHLINTIKLSAMSIGNIISILATIAFIATAATICPLLGIGAAIFGSLVIALSISNKIAHLNISKLGTQNVFIDILSAITKDHITTTNISKENYTKLLESLSNAIDSLPNNTLEETVSNMTKYNRSKNKTLEPLLKAQFSVIATTLFNNTSFKDHLHELQFNVNDLEKKANTYIAETNIEKISESFMGVIYAPLNLKANKNDSNA